jgi:transposase-like protein
MEQIKMQCPESKSTHIRKHGINKQGKQNHICVTCGCQFIDNYEKQKFYDEKGQKIRLISIK